MMAPFLLYVALAPDSAPQLDATKLRAAHEHLRAHVRAGRFPGAVTLVLQNGRIAHQGVTGFADPGRQIPLRASSVFQVMSMTKPVSVISCDLAT